MKQSIPILVIDGQGGGMGCQLVRGLKERLPGVPVTAVGTNAVAAAAMKKSGADQTASGENAVIVASRRAGIIVGPVAIVIADALLGEITPAMAAAVGQSDAWKVLVPFNRCNHIVVGAEDRSAADLLQLALQEVARLVQQP